MAARGRTFVSYFVPHDGDVEEHPNVFRVDRPVAEVRLRDIRDAFPLPGEYLFRFKAQFGKTHVWLDLTDDDAAVPRFEGSIVSKVARLSFAASAGSEPLLPAAAASKGVSASSQRAAAAPTASAARSGSDAGGADGNLDDIFGSDDAPATDGSSTGRGTPGGAAAAGSSEHDGALDGLFDAPAVPAEPATRATPPPQQDDPMGGSRRGRAPVPLAHSMARGGRGTPTGSMSGRGTPTSTAPPPRGGSGPRNFSDLVDF
ncbi:hypothetical protein FNF27_02745 [Cafeteria roenbergensis]|uniref:DIX domain-containing protein n=1 Tax=Cafeteria roenbergensis TaxID=33653 RepID=A0A5A8EEL9_CAFRO|nr:hypothetical protein FNF29_03120 [Cafeteria roenbergensis]KAA0175664.1 hypothetical protein FNF27_02745 [Cafeteria roenbergensis]|eukprot:KAA0153307.1 hypothetical protein FNF29_03120 [Cafeteria roenbergensis]